MSVITEALADLYKKYKMNWLYAGDNKQIMSAEESNKYKNNMKAVFGHRDPTTVFKRKKKIEMAKALETILEDSRWVGIANRASRGKIMSDDMGL